MSARRRPGRRPARLRHGADAYRRSGSARARQRVGCAATGLGVDSVGAAWRLLCTRRFGTFWFASRLSNIGTWAQQVAQPWLLLSLGASPFVIGLDPCIPRCGALDDRCLWF